ncbi:MAG: hypothetical protein ACEPOW_14075 [Bacteroidales bacterium]
MEKEKKIKEEIAEIINKNFRSKFNSINITSNELKKRSGGSSKLTKYELATSSSWNLSSKSIPGIYFNCFGLTMSEFIKEYKFGNIIYLEKDNFITFYKDIPLLKCRGKVLNYDSNNKILELEISDIIESIKISIDEKTPKWLFEIDSKIYFKCKIFAYWRQFSITEIGKFDWTKVWKTFKQEFNSNREWEDNFVKNHSK